MSTNVDEVIEDDSIDEDYYLYDQSDLYDDGEFLVEVDDDICDRPIDQIYCQGCGRPIVIWADVPLKESDLTCARCKQGLNPEWEY